MRLENLIARSAFGWSATSAGWSDTNLGMVAHFDGENTGLTTKPHSACLDYWKRTRIFHVRGRGWKDIGYAYMVCPHRFILEGRGFNRQQAAEAPTPGKIQNGNSRYVAVTFGLGPDETPTADQLAAWHDLRAFLLSEHGIAKTVLGHRDFTATDCPGKKIYALVEDGTLSDVQKEDDESMLPTLNVGTNSFDVKTLRALLFARGYLAPLPNDGLTTKIDLVVNKLNRMSFDADLETMVRNFQTAKKLESDGIVGPKTWAKLLRQ